MSKFANLSDRQFAKQVTEEALEILRTMLPDDVHVERGSASYTSGTFNVKFTFSKVGDDGTVETPERAAFIRSAQFYGLTAEDIDAEFRSGGKTFTIVGLKTRARKRPVLCNGSDGKQYVFPAETVKGLLAVARGTV